MSTPAGCSVTPGAFSSAFSSAFDDATVTCPSFLPESLIVASNVRATQVSLNSKSQEVASNAKATHVHH